MTSLSWKLPEQEKPEYELCPSGNHVARVFQVIDKGTETSEITGREVAQRKVRILWELPNEKLTYSDKSGKEINTVFAIGANYTFSKSERSRLAPILKTLLGTVDETTNIFDILGKTCMVEVEHRVAKSSGRTYAAVKAVTSIPKGVTVPEPVNEHLAFTWEAFDKDVYEKLPRWIKTDWEKNETPEYVAQFGRVKSLNDVSKDASDSIKPEDVPF